MSTELWNDGELKSVTLSTNGFPDEHAPALPDELFLDGEDVSVELTVDVDRYGNRRWELLRSAGGHREAFDDFETAFKEALLAVREVEER